MANVRKVGVRNDREGGKAGPLLKKSESVRKALTGGSREVRTL